MKNKSNTRIEFPSVGRTYARNEYAVYEYGTYPRSSVLAGQMSRTFLDSYDTLEEARAAHPNAEERILDPIPDEDF
jgi:hypothetical protein